MDNRHQGATLVELIISIVIIATASAAILGVLSRNLEGSADAFLVNQAVAVAEAYLEEVTLKPFTDPDGVDAETIRANFDDVDDYDGLLDNGARDQFGNALPNLGNVTVSVAVTPSAALPGVPVGDTLRVDVRVVQSPYVDFVLTGYRTRL